ncbi:IDEAL domain-containing protein [Neobacillus sedimentimangrovi]|uniref:IDEAL domain-containing protein n=2 Tax=Neobacillus sedimentimangrovi TaxID=2699460 RepID=A0ABS8QFX8_9BACI|nr:IDEAL domain-containing protein [Neobacillus sedimentimangrovi]
MITEKIKPFLEVIGMYREGDWIIDKKYKRLGRVSTVFSDGITAKIGGMTALRSFDQVDPAPLDIQQEDIKAMIDLALDTNDQKWFMELSEQLKGEGGHQNE